MINEAKKIKLKRQTPETIRPRIFGSYGYMLQGKPQIL